MEKAKLFIDEDVHDGLAKALRESGIDAVNAKETGRKGFSDKDQLSFAVSQGRAVVSFNIADYEKLAVECFHSNMEHFGIIVSPQRSLKETLHRLRQLLENQSSRDIKNQLFYL
jgi:predicted nuclease of predicted toxin-antitoxin system